MVPGGLSRLSEHTLKIAATLKMSRSKQTEGDEVMTASSLKGRREVPELLQRIDMIETKNLTYSINGKKILDDVSFQIARGDFVALLGPNGSGKTTLIKILSGVYRDYAGSANLNLMHLRQMKPRGIAQFVAVVPQEAHFVYILRMPNLKVQVQNMQSLQI